MLGHRRRSKVMRANESAAQSWPTLRETLHQESQATSLGDLPQPPSEGFSSYDELEETVIQLAEMGLIEPYQAYGESKVRFCLTEAGKQALHAS